MLPPPGISGLASASGMRARNIMHDATVRASSSALSHSPHSYADPSPPAHRQSNTSPPETRVFEAHSEWGKESAVEGGRRAYADGGRGYAGVEGDALGACELRFRTIAELYSGSSTAHQGS